jgi:hypothetical protein
MRKEKDAKIAELEKKLAEQKALFERQIDDLNIDLKSNLSSFFREKRRNIAVRDNNNGAKPDYQNL